MYVAIQIRSLTPSFVTLCAHEIRYITRTYYPFHNLARDFLIRFTHAYTLPITFTSYIHTLPITLVRYLSRNTSPSKSVNMYVIYEEHGYISVSPDLRGGADVVVRAWRQIWHIHFFCSCPALARPRDYNKDTSPHRVPWEGMIQQRIYRLSWVPKIRAFPM